MATPPRIRVQPQDHTPDSTFILCMGQACHKIAARLFWQDGDLWLEIQHRHHGVRHTTVMTVADLYRMLPRPTPTA